MQQYSSLLIAQHWEAWVALALVVVGLWAAAFVIDIKKRLVPNFIPLALIVAGIVASCWETYFPAPEVTFLMRLAGAAVGFFPIALLSVTVGGIGGGDVKLMCASGFVLGLEGALAMLVATCVLGGIAGIVKLVKSHDRKATIAYAPYISIGSVLGLAFAAFGSLL